MPTTIIRDDMAELFLLALAKLFGVAAEELLKEAQ